MDGHPAGASPVHPLSSARNLFLSWRASDESGQVEHLAQPLPLLTSTHESKLQGVEQAWDLDLSCFSCLKLSCNSENAGEECPHTVTVEDVLEASYQQQPG